MSKVIYALAILAAGRLAANSEEVPVGARLELDDALADSLVNSGEASFDAPAQDAPKQSPSKNTKPIRARVLVACEHGTPNDVVSLDSKTLKGAKEAGLLDDDPDAVAYAAQLPQNSGG